MKNTSVKLFEFGPIVQDMSFNGYFLSSPYVQWSGTICAIFVEGIMRNKFL